MSQIKFFKENNFKESPTGKIPTDWQVKKTFELFDVETGSTPSTKLKEYWHDGQINWITPADLSNIEDTIFVKSSSRKITKRGVEANRLRMLPPNSIIISTRAPVGYVAVTQEPTTFNQGCKGLVPKTTINSEFICYYLTSQRKTLENLSGGSTFKELSTDQLERFPIPLPTYSEQEKIISIIEMTERAIRITNEIIKKLENMKAGLLHQLISKGVEHNVFKETRIGRIPEEWDVATLADLITIQSGIYFRFTEFVPEGIPCLKIDNVGFGKTVWDFVTFLPKDYMIKYSDLMLKRGDIVLALNRPIIKGKLKVAILDNKDVPSILYQRVGRITIKDKNRVDNNFLFYTFNSECFLKQFLRSLVGTDQPYITNSLLLKINIALPPVNEQIQLSSILLTLDKKLDLERTEKLSLESVKEALMELLLTGKIRVR